LKESKKEESKDSVIESKAIMNGHSDGSITEEKDDDIETDEAKKIVEALTGSDGQTCTC
jgi:hypothetical protein